MSWTRNRECINRCCNPTCCFTNGVYSNYSQQTRFLSRLHHISYRAFLLPTLIFLPQSRHFSESCIKTLSHIETVIKYLFKKKVWRGGGSKNAVVHLFHSFVYFEICPLLTSCSWKKFWCRFTEIYIENVNFNAICFLFISATWKTKHLIHIMLPPNNFVTVDRK